jgi:hypothetical protein
MIQILSYFQLPLLSQVQFLILLSYWSLKRTMSQCEIVPKCLFA